MYNYTSDYENTLIDSIHVYVSSPNGPLKENYEKEK
jgi:hypothetical protein